MNIELNQIVEAIDALREAVVKMMHNPLGRIDRDGYITWNKGDGTPPFPEGTMINHRNNQPHEDPEKYDLHYFNWHTENPGHTGYRVVSIPHAKMKDFRGRGRRMPEELKGDEWIYFYPRTTPDNCCYDVSKILRGPVKARDMVWWNDEQRVVYWYAVPAL